MRGYRAFTLIELLVVITIIALLIGILLPALAASRRVARQMQSSTQIRGIHSGMILYAQNNNTYYPGLAENGTNSPDGTFPADRYQALLEDGYFTGELMIAPVDVKTTWTTSDVTTQNYSYSMLHIGDDVDGTPRRAEWRDTVNSDAAIMSDRPFGNGVPNGSIWIVDISPLEVQWHGSVGFNDNHVTFETTHILPVTKYGSETRDNDNIFVEDAGTGAPFQSDAVMHYDDTAWDILP